MPNLCAFVDLQSISLLLYKSPLEFWFTNFQYVYSPALFSSSFSEDAFYKALFSDFCEEHKIKLEKCTVAITGALEPPKLSEVPVSFSASLHSVFGAVQNYYPFLVNSTLVCNKDGCFSATHSFHHKKKPLETSESEEENRFANEEIYQQLVTTDPEVQLETDKETISMIAAEHKFPKDTPVVFCGSRFNQNSTPSELDYLTVLNCFKQSGIYDIRIDRNNALILTTLLKMADPKVEIELNLEKEATLIASAGSLECMVKTDVDTSQLVQLDRDRILVLPISPEERVKVMIKSHDLGLVEKTIGGSRLGIIFDTRFTKGLNIDDAKVFSSGLRTFRNVLGA